jgi:hypothetical protein
MHVARLGRGDEAGSTPLSLVPPPGVPFRLRHIITEEGCEHQSFVPVEALDDLLVHKFGGSSGEWRQKRRHSYSALYARSFRL